METTIFVEGLLKNQLTIQGILSHRGLFFSGKMPERERKRQVTAGLGAKSGASVRERGSD